MWNALGTKPYRSVTYIHTYFFSARKKVWNCEFVSIYFFLWVCGLGLFIFGCWLWFILLESHRMKEIENETVAFISHVQNNHFATALIVNCFCFHRILYTLARWNEMDSARNTHTHNTETWLCHATFLLKCAFILHMYKIQ